MPSYDSFDSEDYPAALPNHKPKGTFKDYVRDRADLNKDKPVIPAAALAGYTGRHVSKGRGSGRHCAVYWRLNDAFLASFMGVGKGMGRSVQEVVSHLSHSE